MSQMNRNRSTITFANACRCSAAAGPHRPHETNAPKRLTLKEVKATLAALDISIRSRDGEYRVNFRGGYEASAAYTTDLGDALGTGQAMATRRATQRGRQS